MAESTIIDKDFTDEGMPMDVDEISSRLRELIELARAAEDPPVELAAPEFSLGTPLASQEEATSLFASLQLHARETIEALDNGDYCGDTHGQSPAQELSLAAGVRYRVVYSTDIFAADEHLEATLNAIAQGEEARVSNLLPSRLLIRDREEALVISRGYPAIEHLGFHTSNPAFVRYLCELFDTVWQRALPVTEHRIDGIGGLSGDQLEVLRYLVLGRTDASIARSLGVSERTVQRQIQAIQHGLDARGRFQLGIRVGEFLAERGAGQSTQERGVA